MWVIVLALAVLTGPAQAQTVSPGPADQAPPPTRANIAYGPHNRNTLDLWCEGGRGAAPLVIFIHGGGFTMGDKAEATKEALLRDCRERGIAFAGINYPYLSPATPLPAVLRDCARAVQFLRAHAAEWGLDPARFAAYGTSAGGGIVLWLAFHDDLAVPGAEDPVRRESSRLACAAANSAQFSYDPLRWEEKFGREATERFGRAYRSPLLFGFRTDAEMRSAAGARTRAECEIAGLATRDDPPVFLDAGPRGTGLENENQLLHHPGHALELYEACRLAGVPVVAVIAAYGVAPAPGEPASMREFLLRQLTVRK